MKRYILYSALLSLALLTSCSKEKLLMEKEKDALQERIDAASRIDVKYSVDGQETKSLNYDNKAQDIRVKVDINDPALIWNVESDRQWCEVVPEEHKGPGFFTLSVKANEDFENREEATLTFVAGDYRGSTITVNQDGSVFLLAQPYFVLSKDSGNFMVNVTVQKEDGVEPEWEISSDSWISATKGDIVSQDSESLTRTVNVSCLENDTDTRFGAVTLTLQSHVSTGEIYVSQFGTEYSYDADGVIFFGKDETARIAFTAPEKTIASVKVPTYATYTIEDNQNGTVQVVITAEENFSDCSELRLSQTSLVLSNATASEVALPEFEQDYVPAHGLLTAKGLVRFAAAVNAGEPTDDWEQDGEVVLLGDIDMTGITGWTGIGTKENPFSGVFLGNGHTIDNLTHTSAGLFNVCDEATVKNVTLGEGCSIYCNASFSEDTFLGGIVSECRCSEVSSCTFSGSLEFGASNGSECNAYVGAVVGKADAESAIISCKHNGKLTFSSVQDDELTAYVGGVAGCNLGQTTSCECSGKISLTTNVSHLFAGGILPVLPADATVGGNAFSGDIFLSGSSVENAIGGLYGSVAGNHTFDFNFDKSIILGNITVDKFGGSTAASLFAGGMIGRIEEQSNITVAGFECGCNFTVNHKKVTVTAGYLSVGGAIGGCNPDGTAILTLGGITNIGSVTVPADQTATNINYELLAGIVGYINGSAEITKCKNKAYIGNSENNIGSSKWKCQIVSGIVAMSEGGNLKISECSNAANILSSNYNNNAYSDVRDNRYTCNIQSGILGAFEYVPDDYGNTLTLIKCTSSGYVQGYRGISAGIVGYAKKATITECVSTVDMSGTKMTGTLSGVKNDSAYVGGVAGVLSNSTVTECTVKSNIYANSAGSELENAAGILSMDTGDNKVERCSYYGTVTLGKDLATGASIGGVVANGSASLTVSDCKYGGNINGTVINENNVGQYAVGTGKGTVDGITYWDGK